MDRRIILVFVLALFLVSTLSFISASNPLDGMVGQIEDTKDKVDNTTDRIRTFTREENKWQYLGEVWQEMLLKNPVVAKIDEIFRKGNTVFVVLFGRDYALSLTLIFLIILWFYFWGQFNKIIGTFSTFSSGTSMVISLGMTIILAQMRFFDWASEIIFKLVFFREGVWGWIWAIGGFLVVILVAMIFGNFFTSFRSIARKKREEWERMSERQEGKMWLNTLRLTGQAMQEAFSKDGEKPSNWLWVLIILIIIGFILGVMSF
jgi:hypothetical protein